MLKKACRRLLAASLLIYWPISAATAPLAIADKNTEFVSEWGGHIRAIGTFSAPDDQSIYQFTDTETFYDSIGELRLKHQLFRGSQWTIETHYELVGQKGDTVKNNNRLRTILPTTTIDQLVGSDAINDDRRLMNLTRTLVDGDDYHAYHRLDRFNLTYSFDLGTVRLGRQALTWGNGLIFNPMDLVNPFAPTTVQRDYKVGDDMLHFQWPLGDSEVQLLFLPRRDVESGDIESDQSSYAGKWHFSVGAMEADLMAAHHFNDTVFGFGASGNIGGAAWRSDIIYTLLDDNSANDNFWQVVANLDYAWQWRGKTIYGLIEFFHNGLGEDQDYAHALSNPDISQRGTRGELFTLGRTYLASQIQVELHPLLQSQLITILNIADPSTIVQPQLVWDVVTNLQVIIGANFNLGDDQTEFGGFDATLDGTTIKVTPRESRYLWLTYFF